MAAMEVVEMGTLVTPEILRPQEEEEVGVQFDYQSWEMTLPRLEVVEAGEDSLMVTLLA
jgi:hypothetical protein